MTAASSRPEPHTDVLPRDEENGQVHDPDTRASDWVPLPARRSGPFARLDAGSGSATGLWVGLAVVAAGFGSLFYTWMQVARLLNVALQTPYIVSGGFVGLALVIAGATIVDVTVRRQDSASRNRQMHHLRWILIELRQAVEVADQERNNRP